MRIRAAETDEYAGSDDANFLGGGEYPSSATVTVWRLVQGTRYPFTATARWSEYKPDQNDFQWRKMPHTMLAKCAEALALRKGFPRQLAGLYAREELDQATERGVGPVDPNTGEVVDAEPNGNGTPKPAGYEDWLADMEAKADEGTAALRHAWKEARPDLRAAMPLRVREQLKQKAAQVPA